MISYAIVDRIEGDFAVCEVVLVPVEACAFEDLLDEPTEMMDVELEKIQDVVGEVEECTVLVVEHDSQSVQAIIEKYET